MGSIGGIRDLGSVIKCLALQAQNGVAAGAGDNTELTSEVINRNEAGAAGFMSAVLCLAYKMNLTAAQTCALTLKISESDDGTNWDADEVLQNAVVIETGAQVNVVDEFEQAFDLSERKQYIRFKITMNLSAGATDTFVYGGCIVLGGADRLPV